MPKKRILWADIAKFFAIVLMVWCHLGMPQNLSIVIHMFHMPIFFILGGMFYDKAKYKKFSAFFLSRVKSLIVPYFAWGVISYAIYRLIPYVTGMTEIVSVRRFILALFTQDANEVLFSGFGVIQWFFTSLFLSEMVLWVIIRLSDRINKSYQRLYFGIISVVLIIVNGFVCSHIEHNWLGFKSSILGTLCCLFGFILKNEIKQILDAGNRSKLIISFFAIAVFVAVFFLNGSVNMRITRYNNQLLFILGAISGSLLVFIFSREVENYLPDGLLKTYILYIGRHTALILCTNRLVQYTFIFLMNNLIAHFMRVESGFGLYSRQIVDLVVEMIIFVPIIYVVNRWIPFTVGKPLRSSE